MAQINQLINQAMDLDGSIDAMISELNALFWTMIMYVTNSLADFSEFVTEVNDDF